MTNIEKKSAIQGEALDKWCFYKKGTVALATGLGKTKLGIDAINLLSAIQSSLLVLIIVPSTRLRDNEWVTEKKKWKKFDGRKVKVSIECIQTVHRDKYKNRKWDLVIVDELHMMLGPEFKKSLSFECEWMLGLTATPPYHDEDKMAIINDKCPIIYTKTIQDAIAEGLSSPFEVINLKTGFNKKERATYNVWETKMTNSRNTINKGIRSLGPDLFTYYGYEGKLNVFEYSAWATKDKMRPYYKEASMFWTAMSRRKYVCYNAESKVDTVKQIIDLYPDRKWIVFCQTIASADKIAKDLEDIALLYHSKVDPPDLSTFGEKLRVIVSVKGLIAGLNIPSLNSAIAVSYDSVAGNFDQSAGRICRFIEDKQGLYVNLVVPKTQEAKWLEKRTKNYQTKEVSSVYKWV